MRAIELLLPQALALIGGTLAVRFAFPSGRAGWLSALGYGYVVGLVLGAAGLYISGTVGLGVRFLAVMPPFVPMASGRVRSG